MRKIEQDILAPSSEVPLRRFFLATVLLLSFVHFVGAQSQPPVHSDPVTESDRLRTAAHALLRSGSSEDTTKAADLLLKAAQIDAANAQTARDNSERGATWKGIVAPLTSLFTTLILAGTLVFNIYQGRLTEREKLKDRVLQQDADERKRLVEALEMIQKAESISPVAALINTFTTEPYRSEARRMGRTVLMHMSSIEEFRDLFSSIFEPPSPGNLPGVLELLRAVDARLNPMLAKTWTGKTNDSSRLAAEEAEQYKLLVAQRALLSAALASILRLPERSPTPLNLSRMGLDYANLQGADLRNSIVSSSAWATLNLDGADLRGITEFQGFVMYNTAWWHAAAIDPPLLEFLSTNFPYTNQRGYSQPPLSTQEYDENVRRLRAGKVHPSPSAS